MLKNLIFGLGILNMIPSESLKVELKFFAVCSGVILARFPDFFGFFLNTSYFE